MESNRTNIVGWSYCSDRERVPGHRRDGTVESPNGWMAEDTQILKSDR